ncbi:MAG: hypothetical protein II601_00185 [Lachnospiraceae bacterium]|nr:hypothetical protein [Lachnospiraceae bacterium]
MKFRIAIIVFSALFLGAAVFGLTHRLSYTDLNKDASWVGEAVVRSYDDETLMEILDKWWNGIPEDKEHDIPAMAGLFEAPEVAAVRCEEAAVFRYRTVTQKVRVQKVFRGERITEGEELELVEGSVYRNDEYQLEAAGLFSIGGGVNFMIPGKTYLVFLDRDENAAHNDKTWGFFRGWIHPQFCYDEIRTTPVTPISPGSIWSRYQDCRENEFFLTSAEAVSRMADFKRDVLLKYPLEGKSGEGGAK